MFLDGKLEIVVQRGFDLPNLDGSKLRKSSDKSDPYVVVKLVDGGKKEAKLGKTRTINNCLDPVWNHAIDYVVNQEIEELRFEIFDDDKFKDDKMGTAIVNVNAFSDPEAFENEVPVFDKKGNRAGNLAVKIKFTAS